MEKNDKDIYKKSFDIHNIPTIVNIKNQNQHFKYERLVKNSQPDKKKKNIIEPFNIHSVPHIPVFNIPFSHIKLFKKIKTD